MRRFITIFFLIFLLRSHALECSRLFGSGMVLPADREVVITGRGADPAGLSVEFSGHRVTGKVDANGEWSATLPAMPASGTGQQMEIRSGSKQLILDDILIGEVWLCAGQSNMDFSLGRAVGGKPEAEKASDRTQIRLMNWTGVHTANRAYQPAELARMEPDRYFQGQWQRADPSSASAFSAVGWWAGRMIHESSRVPIGLIDVSVGGSGAEAWLPSEVLQARPVYTTLLGKEWIESERVSAWARGRARLNIGENGVNHPFRPGFLFDAGVRPWRGFPLSGVLWYQGETNAEIHDDEWNERLITDMVLGWRRVLEAPKLPFFMVQLPRIGGNDPLRQWWPQFRQVQARAAAKLDGVELVVTEDLGWDSPDVHPPDKKPVGERLGQAVLTERNR
ncbi:MAG: sialate O-acetylesterase [Luteolibacter sp.]